MAVGCKQFSSARKGREAAVFGTGVRAYTVIDVLVFLVCLAVLGGVVVLPQLARPKCGCQRINCTNNLKQIGLSFKQWSLDNQDRFPMEVAVTNGGTMEFVTSGAAWVHFTVISNELNTPKVLFCPQERAKGRISSTTFGSIPTAGQVPFTNDNNVTYFVGVDAVQTNGAMFLAGDRNLTNSITRPRGLTNFPTNQPTGWTHELHNGMGNISLADGSVQQFTTRRVRSGLIETGVATTRLAMP